MSPTLPATAHPTTPDRASARALPTIALLATSPTFRAYADQSTVIPALPDDTVTYLLDQLTAARGSALLTLCGVDGAVRVVSLVDVTTQATGGTGSLDGAG